MEPFKQVAGFVLAGGESSRMGRDKALLELGGVPLVVRAARLVGEVAGPVTVIARAAGSDGYDRLGFPVVGDDFPGVGPLGGIATALRHSAHSWNLVIGCDLPYLTRSWLAHLIERATPLPADALLPASEHGLEPLCAMYHRNCAPAISAALASGMRKITTALAGLHVETIPLDVWKGFDSDGRLFKNMNTPADYEEARAYFGGPER